ncbi:MAG: diguanylate cyclase [Christensenellales bacterium]|jgi:diguanylate cyclase (GGDEF)-like protein
MIRKRLSLIIIATLLFSLGLNYFLQIHSVRADMVQDSLERFWQIGQVLDQNEAESEQIQRDFKNNCLIRAKAAAYIVQYRPEIIGDQREMDKIAELLQVDEFHLFDQEGTIYAGSEPKYFGYNFNSGDQMRFFLPMLQDRDLELCQDVTPNTAEQKLMQYAAVWREDGEGIVQIGMEPQRVLDAMKKNELSYIFSLVTFDSGTTIYALDPDSYQVLGSTNPLHVDKTVQQLGIDPERVLGSPKGFPTQVDGQASYCVFSSMGSFILGRVTTDAALYESMNRNSLLLAGYLVLIAIIMIVSISVYLDGYIIEGIAAVNRKLLAITHGHLDEHVQVDTTPEFAQLSSHINAMVTSILDTTNKLSAVLDTAKVPIGVYEYNPGMKRVMATSRVPEILGLSAEQAQTVLQDYTLFEQTLDQVRCQPVDAERAIYRLPGEGTRYVRIESIQREHSTLGILLDVTEETLEKRRIEHERDVDQLTGLFNRRAFYQRMDALFVRPELLGLSVLIMIDADNLKQVNDLHGHESGDRYLQGIADLLRRVGDARSVIARLSGDEFVLFSYGHADAGAREAFVRRLQLTMNETSVELTDQVCVPVRFSMGCARQPEEALDYHWLLKCADERMYQQKKTRGARP